VVLRGGDAQEDLVVSTGPGPCAMYLIVTVFIVGVVSAVLDEAGVAIASLICIWKFSPRYPYGRAARLEGCPARSGR